MTTDRADRYRRVLRAFVLAFGLGATTISAARAEVRLPDGDYFDRSEDLRVKVLGGQLRISRTWTRNHWYFNPEWAALTFSYDTLDASVRVITRIGADYKRASQGVYIFDSNNTIRSTSEGYRWEDRRGNWITYEGSGQITAYGDRNNVKVTFKYDSPGRLSAVLDHFGTEILRYEYTGTQVATVRDYSGRKVQYRYSGANLSEVVDVLGNTWKYTYDSAGRLLTSTDPENRTRALTYSANGRVSNATNADGTSTQYLYDYDSGKKQYYIRTTHPDQSVDEDWYDSQGLLIRVAVNGVQTYTLLLDTGARTTTDETGQQTQDQVDEWGNLTRRVYADGSAEAWEYDPTYSNITKYVDPNGHAARFEYDAKGNLVRQIDAADTSAAQTTDFAYDAYGNIISVARRGDSDLADAVVSYTYDSYGNRITVTDPESGVSAFTYDAIGNAIVYTDGRGKVWANSYDAAGHLTAKVDPLGRTTQYRYDKVGNLLEVSSPAGKTTAYAYDASNRRIKTTDALGNIQQAEYDGSGRLTARRDENGSTVAMQYDLFGRMIALTDSDGNSIGLQYSSEDSAQTAATRPTRIVFPLIQRRLTYNARGRTVSINDQFDSGVRAASFLFDAKGNQLGRIDPKGNKMQFGHDPLDRVAAITDRLGGVTQFAYSQRGRLVSVVDALGNRHKLLYDRADRLIQEARPDGGTIKYRYDDAGNLLEISDPRGQRISYVYDDAGQRVSETHYAGENQPAQKTITYQYDAAGNLTGWDDGSSSATIGYDDVNRRVSESLTFGSLTLVSRHAYLPNGRKKSVTYPSGTTVSYAYSAGNHLSSVTVSDAGSVVVGDRLWYAPKTITFPGGVTQHRSYDAYLNLESLQVTTASGSPVFSLADEFDSLEQLVGRTIDQSRTQYGYDAEKHLVSVQRPAGAEQTFALDSIANRVGDSLNPGDWIYDENGQLLQQPGVGYAYDANGNRASDTSTGAGRAYTYDVLNRLTRVQTADGSAIAEYGYDPFDRRIWKRTGSSLTFYVYGSEGLLGEYNELGEEIVAYGWQPSTTWGTNPLFLKRGAGYFFFQNDHLGTPLRLTDKSGAVVWKAEYDPFGKADVAGFSTVGNNLRFAGQYFDGETGLHYNFRRYYDPATGGYLSSDPIGLKAGPNLYAYVEHNPTNSVDPKGEFLAAPVVVETAEEGALIGAEIGTAIEPGGGTAIGAVVGGIVGAAIGAAAIWYITHPDSATKDRADPGDCTEEQHAALQDAVNAACKGRPRACKGNQDCDTLRDNYDRSKQCADARDTVNNVCYGGGDDDHRKAADEARKALDNCLYFMRKKKCPPCP